MYFTPICLLHKVESCSADNFTFVSIIIMALMSERAIVQAHYLCPSFRHATCSRADFVYALSRYFVARKIFQITRDWIK